MDSKENVAKDNHEESTSQISAEVVTLFQELSAHQEKSVMMTQPSVSQQRISGSNTSSVSWKNPDPSSPSTYFDEMKEFIGKSREEPVSALDVASHVYEESFNELLKENDEGPDRYHKKAKTYLVEPSDYFTEKLKEDPSVYLEAGNPHFGEKNDGQCNRHEEPSRYLDVTSEYLVEASDYHDQPHEEPSRYLEVASEYLVEASDYHDQPYEEPNRSLEVASGERVSAVKMYPSIKGLSIEDTYEGFDERGVSHIKGYNSSLFSNYRSPGMNNSSIEQTLPAGENKFHVDSEYQPEAQTVSLLSAGSPWTLRESVTAQGMFEELVTDTDYDGEPSMPPVDQAPKLSSQNLFGSRMTHENKLELLHTKQFWGNSTSEGTAEQSKQYQIEKLFASYFPDTPASNYMKELDKLNRKEQEDIFSALEKLDNGIFQRSDISESGETHYPSSGDQSSIMSNSHHSWSSRSVSSRTTQNSQDPAERETLVTTYNDNKIYCDMNTQTDTRTPSESPSSILRKYNVDLDEPCASGPRPLQQLKTTVPSEVTDKSKDCELIIVALLLDNGDVNKMECERCVSMFEMRYDLSEFLSIPMEEIYLMKYGEVLEDELLLNELLIERDGTIKLQLSIEDSFEDLEQIESNESIHDVPVPKPDIIKVTIRSDIEDDREVVVEVWHQAMVKPWIGGYRDKKTFQEFHHAFSQTPPHVPPTQLKIERVTQTTVSRTKDQSTKVDHATQVYTTQAYIPCVGDKIMTSKKYVTFAEIYVQQQYKLRKVVIIQRNLRAFLIRKMIHNASEEYRRLMAQDNFAMEKVAEEKIKKRQVEVARKVYPRTRADFETLYNCVEKWRVGEVTKIKEQQLEATLKKVTFGALLEKEIVLLNSIDSHRVRLRDDKKVTQELEFTTKSSQPISWTNKYGDMIYMDTLETQRSREMGHLYLSLCDDDATTEARVNLLVTLKHALKTYNTRSDPKVNELLKLMVRECDCMVRGLRPGDTDMLRHRLRRLYLDVMRDPANNCEAAKYTGTVNTATIDALHMYKCSRCSQFKPPDSFAKTTLTRNLNLCVACQWLENIAGRRNDLGPYRSIVHALRCDEERRCCHLSFAYMMQEADIYYLVCTIWHSRSAISECENLDLLRMARWEVQEDWSPWNCILLEEKEAKEHVLLEDLPRVYEDTFVRKVKAKHQLGRKYFRRLAAVDQRLRDSGKWYQKIRHVRYVKPTPVAHAFH